MENFTIKAPSASFTSNLLMKLVSKIKTKKTPTKSFAGLFMLLLTFFLSGNVSAQTTYSWRNDQTPANNASWLSTSPYYFWNGTTNTGAVPPGGEILYFDGAAGTTMTNNLSATNRYGFSFGNTTAPSSRTINGSTTNIFYDFSSGIPYIVNSSGVTHTINFPFQIGNTNAATSTPYGMELNASSGSLIFGTSATISAANATGTKVLVLRASGGGSGTITLGGAISNGSGTMSISKIETNTAILTASNSFTGTTTITGGELRLNPASTPSTYASQIILNGGTLGTTGITASSAWTSSSTLSVNASSAISLQSATAHTLTFANSSAVSWTSGAIVSISGWSGSYNGTTGTGGKIFVGSDATGLSASQLAKIYFINGGNAYSATILSNGEIVPTANICLFWGGISTDTWTSSKWGLLPAGPFASAWTSGRTAVFNTASSSITAGASATISGIIANESVTITSSGGTITPSSATTPVFVASGKTFEFGSQAIATGASSGFVKNGPGTFGLVGAAYTGGFTLNSGTVLVEGTQALGTGALTINGGVIVASSATARSLTFTGITIGGDFQLGDATNYSSNTGTISFAGAVSLGNSTTRTITLGAAVAYTFSGAIGGTSSNIILNANAAGTLTFSGANTYGGSTTINGGTLLCGAATTLPSTTDVIIANTSGATLSLGAFNQTIKSLAGGGTTGGNVSLGTATLSVTGASTTTYSGAFAATAGGLTVNNASAVLTLANASNAHTGTTTITAGQLRLNPASTTATYASQIQLNGGKLSTTGITAGTTWTNSSTLNLNANSTLDLAASTVHTISFANSSAVTWAGSTLTISGWSGTAGVSGTGGKLFVGSNNTGLTAAQLAKISFTGYSGVATILSTGEIVPKAPVNYYVTTSGSDANSGLFGSPKATIQSVLSTYALSGGDIINVAAGNYTEVGIFPGSDDSNFTIQGAALSNGAPTTIFTGTASGRWLTIGSDSSSASANDNITINNITVKNYTSNTAVNGLTAANGYGGGAIFIRASATGTSINNCVFDTCTTQLTSTATPQYGGAINAVDYFTVSNSVFKNCSSYGDAGAIGIYATGDGAVYTSSNTSLIDKCTFFNNKSGIGSNGDGSAIANGMNSTTKLLVQNSLFYNNDSRSVNSGNGAITSKNSSTVSVMNCTITKNTGTGTGGIYTASAVMYVVNTIAVANLPASAGGDINSASSTLAVANSYYQFAGSMNSSTGNTVGTTPGFTNATGNDFTLTTGAACINLGTPSALSSYGNATPPTQDIRSNTRVANPDIGAYEGTGCDVAQATTLGTASITATGTTVSWTRGGGDGVIVVAHLTSDPITDPTNGTTYTGNAAYTSGTALGSGYVVYAGTGTSVAVTGLTTNASYTYDVYEYKNTGGCTMIYNTVELTGSVGTCITPVTPVSGVTFSAVNANSMKISWTRGSGQNVVVRIKAAATPTALTNGTDPATASTVYAADGIIYNGTGTSVIVTGLTASTSYTVSLYESNCSGTDRKYSTVVNGTQSSTSSNVFYSKYSTANTDATIVTNWNTATDGSGVDAVASNFTSTTTTTFTIQSGHQYQAKSAWTGGSAVSVIVSNGGSFDFGAQTVTAFSGFSIAGTGVGVSNTGAIYNSASSSSCSIPISLSGTATISSYTGGSLTLSGAITNNGNALTLEGTTTLTLSGAIGGAGGLIKAGTGTAILSSATSGYTGTTSINNGTIRVITNNVTPSAAGPLGLNATLTLNGGTLETNVTTFSRPISVTADNSRIDAYGAAQTVSGAISTTGNFTLNLGGTFVSTFAGQQLTLSGIMSNGTGTLNINKTGTSTVVLSGASTYTGSTTISNGLLFLGNVGTSTTGPLGANTSSLIINGGSLNLNAVGTFLTPIATTITGTGYTSLGAIYNVGATATYPGNITVGSVGATIAAGTGTASITTNFTGTVNTNGNALTLGNSTDVSTRILSFNNVISGNGSITKAGPSVLTLSGNNSYSGGTTIGASAGTLNINSATALGTGIFTINGSTINNSTAGSITLSNNNPITVGGDFTFTGTQALNLGVGTFTLTGNRSVTVSASTLTIGSNLTGSFMLIKSPVSTGTLTITPFKTAIATWALASANTCATAGVTGSGNALVVGGSGIGTLGTSASGSSATVSSTSIVTATSGYFDFAYLPTQNASITQIKFDYLLGSGSNPYTFALYYTTNNGTSYTQVNANITNITNTAANTMIADLISGPISVASGSTIKFRLFAAIPSGTATTVKLANFTVLGTLQSVLTTSVASLTAFTTCPGTASAYQSFTVSGTNLNNNVVVTPPTGYEVCLTSGGTYTSSVTISASGTLSATTVYVRLSATASGSPSGNITCVSIGATTQNVSVSGVVSTPSAPNYVVHTAGTGSTSNACSSSTYWDATPTAGVALNLKWNIELNGQYTNTGIYYTTDGSTPSGSRGVGSGTTTFVAGSYFCTSGSSKDVAQGTIPAIANVAGNTINYIIGAWNGCGTEGFAAVNYSLLNTTPTVYSYSIGDPSTADYRSRASSSWNTVATWEYNYTTTGGTQYWANATQLPAATNNVLVQAAHTVTLDVSPTVNSPKTITLSGTLVAGTNTISGTGSFVTSSGATLKTGNANGITSSGTSGTIQVSGTRTFNAGSNYEYNGAVNQATGNGLSTTLSGTLTINNSGSTGNNTVSLTTTGTTAPTLNLTSGLFAVGSSNTLNITSGGTVTAGTGNFASGTSGGTVNFNGSGTISGTVGFNNASLSGGVDFGSASTINGNLTINVGGYVATNAPTYATNSTLIYNSGTTYGRNLEWSTTTGKGYPYNVQISGNTTLDVGANSGNATARQIAGNLTTDSGSTFTMNSAGSQMSAAVTVYGNVLNNGTITLSSVYGGDINVKGNWTDNNTFNANARAVFFTGSGTQTIDGTASAPFNIDYVVVTKSAGAGPVVLNKDLLVGAPSTGTAITLSSANDILDLNGHTITIGTTGVACGISGTGTFKGSSSSNISILGTGAFGTVYFDQTTPGTTNVLNGLTLNRTLTSGGMVLGNDVNVSGSLTLTSGTLDLSSNNLTIGGSGSISVPSPSATTMVIASSTGQLRKTFTANGSFTFPVGDNTGTAEYSPVTIAATGSAYSSAYIGVSLADATHTNNYSTTNYLTRYWNVIQSGITGCTATVTGTYINTASDVAGTLGSIKAAQLNGIFNQSTNPWIKTGGSVLSGTTLTYTGATLTSGQTSAFTGITSADPSVSITGGNVTVCKDAVTTLTANPTGGDGTLTYSWSGLITGSTTSSTASATTSSAGGPNSYTVTVKDANGISAASSAATVTVSAPSIGGSIAGSATVCTGTNSTGLTLSGYTGTITRWESSLDNFATAGTTIVNTTTSQTATNLTATTYYRAVITSGSCSSTNSVTATVTVTSNNTAGSASSSPTVCISTAITSITHSTTGATGISNSGVSGANGLPTGVSALWSSNTVTISGTPTASGVFNYSIPLTGGCGSINATGTITVNAASVGGTATATAPIRCSGTSTTLVLSGNTGSTIQWQQSSSADGSTGWSNVTGGSGATSSTYTTPNLTATTYYKAVVTSGSCTSSDSSTASVTMEVVAANTSSQTICSGVANLSASVPSSNTIGAWTIVSGPNTSTTQFSNTALPSASFTPTTAGSYVIRWTISGGFCSTSYADATIVVGSGSATTWNGTAWSNGAPTSTSTAYITGNYSSTTNGGSIIACTLTVSNNAVVNIASANDIILNGVLTVGTGSSVTIENNASLVQSANVTNVGKIIFKHNSSALFRLDYTLWSSPVASQNLVLFSPLTSVSPSRFYTYNTSTDLYDPITPPSASTFNIAQGYLIRMPNTWVAVGAGSAAAWTGTFTGVPNNGNISITMSNAGQGYNAVGNPYPSAINFANFVYANSANIEGTVYFWRKTNNSANPVSYSTCTTVGCTVNNGHTYTHPELISAGQGFIVQAKAGRTTLNFTNGMRTSDNVNQFFRTSVVNRFWLELSNTANASFGKKLIAYIPDATLGYDNGLDGLFLNDTKTALLSVSDNHDLVIQARPAFTADDVVPLVLKADVADTYTITLQEVEGVFNGSQTIFLKDKLTNTSHDFSTGAYTFTTDAGRFDNRFEIVYQNPLAVQQPTFNDTSVVVYKQNNELIINSGNTSMSNVKVFDIRGRLLMEKNNINATQTKFYTGTTNEVLLVQITSDAMGTVTKKVIN